MKKYLIGILIIIIIALVYYLLQIREQQPDNKLRFLSLAWQESTIATNKSIVEEWNSNNPDIPVEYVQGTWNSAHDYLITTFETGDVPDIFHYESSVIIDYAMRGYLADLSPYISSEMKSDILDVAWATVTRPNGEINGIPFLIESLVVLYNKTLFERAGIIPPSAAQPWDWEQLRNAAKLMTRDFNYDGITDQYGSGIGLRNSANIIMNTSISFGGSFFKKDNNHFKVEVNEEEKNLLRTIYNMLYKDKSVAPSSIGESGAGMIPGFFSGRYAMMIGIGSWGRQQLVENAPADFKWGVMPPIKAKNQNYGASTQTLSIPKKSRRIEDAMKFIDFMLNSKNMARLALNDWMIPARKSCLLMPEFQDTVGGWNATIAAVNNLTVGSWLGAPGYVEWKSRIANPVLQELFAGRIDVEEASRRIEYESNIILERYRKRGDVW